MALAILPPDGCELLLETAGATLVRCSLAGYSEEGIVLTAPDDTARPGDTVTVLVVDERRAGFAVEGDVAACGPVPEGGQSIRVAVAAIRRVKDRRVSGRTATDESAVVETRWEAFDVEVIDVGKDGFAFIIDQAVALGESLAVTLNLGGLAIPARAHVINVSPLQYPHSRVGCRFSAISATHLQAVLHATQRDASATNRRQDHAPTGTPPLSAQIQRTQHPA
jgi:hypothetical protein